MRLHSLVMRDGLIVTRNLLLAVSPGSLRSLHSSEDWTGARGRNSNLGGLTQHKVSITASQSTKVSRREKVGNSLLKSNMGEICSREYIIFAEDDVNRFKSQVLQIL